MNKPLKRPPKHVYYPDDEDQPAHPFPDPYGWEPDEEPDE